MKTILARIVPGILLLTIPSTQARQPGPGEYQPVAPPKALVKALQGSQAVLRQWIDDKDFSSASGAGREFSLLLQLSRLVSNKPEWRAGIETLQSHSAKLSDAIRVKDEKACAALLIECEKTLEKLSAIDADKEAVAIKEFRPFGGNTLWMRLMDGAYGDAKTSRDPKDVELLALAIAEEINAVGFLRREARWQQLSRDVREAALAAAKTTRESGLDAGKKALKVVYQRCEVCHNASKRE